MQFLYRGNIQRIQFRRTVDGYSRYLILSTDNNILVIHNLRLY